MSEVLPELKETEKSDCGDVNNFKVPEKCVKSAQDIPIWEKSDAYQEYLGFIFAVGDTIKGKKIRDIKVDKHDEESVVVGLINLFEELDKWISEIPLVEQQQRFGNKAFREWHDRLKQKSTELIEAVLSRKIKDSKRIKAIVQEIQVYLVESFGNSTRIDYGTGHEMSFVMFLASLFMVGALDKEQDRAPIGLVVFDKYMRLVRRLQSTYRMEPAGSQGVWSLDDYQFVAFIWGAAQMVGHSRVKPKSISDYDVAEILAPDYHFFACIKYISSVKTGPFAEHSNQLWNVSGVPLWEKVYSGLVKMYRAEILSKFPVIQHTYFGSLFSLKQANNTTATERLEMGHNGTSRTIRENLTSNSKMPQRLPVISPKQQ